MNKKQTITFIVLFLLLVAGGIGVYFLQNKTDSLKNEISTIHSEVMSLSAQSARLLSLRQVGTSQNSDIENLNEFFIDAQGALDFVKYIETIAVSSGLDFRIEAVDEVNDAALAAQDKVFLHLSVRGTGTLKNTKIFLALIESLPYNVKINRIDLRRAGENWSVVVDFHVVKILEK